MERLSGSAKLLRAMNTSAVLSHLLNRGPLTRADIRELTGLSKPTTCDVLRKLVEADLAMVIGHTSGGPGPNAEIYATNPDGAFAAAISVRETTGAPEIAIAIVDLAGVIRARTEVAINLATDDPAAVLAAALLDAVRRDAASPPTGSGTPTSACRAPTTRPATRSATSTCPGWTDPASSRRCGGPSVRRSRSTTT